MLFDKACTFRRVASYFMMYVLFMYGLYRLGQSLRKQISFIAVAGMVMGYKSIDHAWNAISGESMDT